MFNCITGEFQLLQLFSLFRNITSSRSSSVSGLLVRVWLYGDIYTYIYVCISIYSIYILLLKIQWDSMEISKGAYPGLIHNFHTHWCRNFNVNRVKVLFYFISFVLFFHYFVLFVIFFAAQLTLLEIFLLSFPHYANVLYTVYTAAVYILEYIQVHTDTVYARVWDFPVIKLSSSSLRESP